MFFDKFGPATVGSLFLLLSVTASAHQDRMFEITSSGDIEGFPPNYGPASLIVGEESEGNNLPTVRLTIRGYSIDLPECLRMLFILPPGQTIRATGSWYHDLKLLPPYLNLDLPQRDIGDYGDFEGYSILFDVTTLDIIQIDKHHIVEGEQGPSISEVDISSLCPPDALHDLVAR